MKGNREVTPEVALIPITATSDVDGPDIDTSLHDIADIHLNLGTAAATSVINCILEEADDDGAGAPDTYAPVVGAVFPEVLAAATPKALHMSVNLRARKKWIRLNMITTVADATYSAVCALSCLKYNVPSASGALPVPDVEVGF